MERVGRPAAWRAIPAPWTPPRVALSLATIALLLLAAQAAGLVLRFEMLGGRRAEGLGGRPDLTYNLLCTAEESLEMGGLILLTYALLSACRTRAGPGQATRARAY